MNPINLDGITELWQALHDDYDACRIDVECLTYGTGTLYQLVKKTQGEPFAKMWSGEQHRALEERMMTNEARK